MRNRGNPKIGGIVVLTKRTRAANGASLAKDEFPSFGGVNKNGKGEKRLYDMYGNKRTNATL